MVPSRILVKVECILMMLHAPSKYGHVQVFRDRCWGRKTQSIYAAFGMLEAHMRHLGVGLETHITALPLAAVNPHARG